MMSLLIQVHTEHTSPLLKQDRPWEFLADMHVEHTHVVHTSIGISCCVS